MSRNLERLKRVRDALEQQATAELGRREACLAYARKQVHGWRLAIDAEARSTCAVQPDAFGRWYTAGLAREALAQNHLLNLERAVAAARHDRDRAALQTEQVATVQARAVAAVRQAALRREQVRLDDRGRRRSASHRR